MEKTRRWCSDISANSVFYPTVNSSWKAF